jgi:hypothetical protein
VDYDDQNLTVRFTTRIKKTLPETLFGDSKFQIDANKLAHGHRGMFHIYVDVDLFETHTARDVYISRYLEEKQLEYDYLSSVFEFEPPTERIVSVQLPASIKGSTGAFAGAFFIVAGFEDGSRLTEETVEERFFIHAPHELVHVFFAGVPDYCDFEEGLADFLQDLMNRDNPNLLKLKCHENGWQHANVDEHGNILPFGEVVPFFDFSRAIDRGAERYSRQSQTSYYKSGQCFWQYIYELYGLEAIGKIAHARHELRLEFPPTYKSFISDVVYDAINVDLRSFMEERFNYFEYE